MQISNGKPSIHLQQERVGDYRVADYSREEYSCQDMQGYDFIRSETECEEAEKYLQSRNILELDSYKDESGGSVGRWFVFNNITERPYGCYYFPRQGGKGKIVHPKNMCLGTREQCTGIGQVAYYQNNGNIKPVAMQSAHLQICKKTVALQQDQDQDAETSVQTSVQTGVQTGVQTSVRPTIVPFCQLNKGTRRGENIQKTSLVYKCPAGSSIICPVGFSVDNDKITTKCVWADSTTQPPTKIPEPGCKPDTAKTVYAAKCLPNEVTEHTCATGTCVQQAGTHGDCTCAQGVEITEISCRAFEEVTEEEVGLMTCGEYGTGYQLACPDGYTLNETTQMCDEDSVQLYEYDTEYSDEKNAVQLSQSETLQAI